MKPWIAVTAQWDEETNQLSIRNEYIDAVRKMGCLPLLVPVDANGQDLEALCAAVSGFLFTGGPDVQPSRYGQAQSPQCKAVCEKRDALETALFRLATDSQKPIFGICRGAQLINVCRGGTLCQHLPTAAAHLDGAVHAVTVFPSTFFSEQVQEQRFLVNSFHHQAVERLGRGFVVAAKADDGVTEAFVADSGPYLVGVQWHPERDTGDTAVSDRLWKSFADRVFRQAEHG